MQTHFTADPHLGHASIMKHCQRPWSTTEAMDKQLIENWNGLVDKKDTVYILGDFAWGNHKHYINALNGKKILILGNHDKMDQGSLDQFTQVVGKNKQPGTLELVLDGKLVILSHYRMVTWRGSCHGSWHFYGHSHGRMREGYDSLCCDVGVDVWDYAPVPWEALKLKIAARQVAWDARRQTGTGQAWEEYDEYVNPLRLENRQYRDAYNTGGI